MSDKTLVERMIEAKPVSCADFAKILGIECLEQKDCITCRHIICCSIANEIEGWYIPRPRYEDGEPVQFGDTYTDKNGSEWKNGIKSIHIDCNGDFSLHDSTIGDVGRYEVFGRDRRVKRHKPDNLERIEEDAGKSVCEYFNRKIGDCKDCEGFGGCRVKMTRDLLRRQREVLERDNKH